MKKFLFLSGICWVLAGCTEPPPPMLTSEDRNLIDSITKLQAKDLKPYYDSLCDAKFDREVLKAVDSIMEVRLEEIARQKARIQQKKQ